MKDYNIISPFIDGILSDDYLYFEGICRPQEILRLRDSEELKYHSYEVLEKYFNDIYNLFLRKISLFSSFEYTSEEETIKLQALLQELIKVKKIIKEKPENGI